VAVFLQIVVEVFECMFTHFTTFNTFSFTTVGDQIRRIIAYVFSVINELKKKYHLIPFSPGNFQATKKSLTHKNFSQSGSIIFLHTCLLLIRFSR
jgi:hypothetical protein